MEPPAGLEPATTGSPGGSLDFGSPRPYEAGALPLSYGGARLRLGGGASGGLMA